MFRRSIATVAILTIGFLAGALMTGRLQSVGEDPAPPAAKEPGGGAPAPEAAAAQGGGGALPDFTQIAARTSPAVVNISAVQVMQQRFRDPFFERFFGRDTEPARGASAGSGVIVSSDGYVITNSHVLQEQQGAALESVKVILSDKRERPAKLIGTDPWTDLALLKINEKNLPAITWGDSSSLRVAEWVLAIGNPYQLGQTVTLGIVSATNRSYENVSALVDYIQTDAAINPGNSGGALFNRRGELVGINTWIATESGGDQGIGFAIPSNIARQVADELIKTGAVTRGSIGAVRFVAVTPALARDLELSEAKGALVWSLYRTASAYRAGLRPGDVVVALDGRPVDEPAQLQRPLLQAPIGSIVTLRVIRQGESREIKVQIESQASAAGRRSVAG